MTTSTRRGRKRNGFFPPLMIDHGSRKPIHRQLYDWYQAAIADGRLRPGERVPSTRSLAVELNVSRAPVLVAFEQLIAEGYFQASIGAGTRISDAIPEFSLRPERAGPARTARRSGTRRVSRIAASLMSDDKPWLAHAGPFRTSSPALDHFPSRIWSSLLARHSNNPAAGMLAYGDSMGHWPLREAIARYLGAARAVRCSAAQIMIVSGSQQGLQVAAQSLLDAGDSVWIEEPGYPGAHVAFGMVGARMTPIPVDDEGLDVEHGLQSEPGARLAYVTPSHQYPLGTGMSAARRMQLLNWADRNDAWIIEDDYDSEYRFGAHPMMSLQGLDTSEKVIYLGTFSKVIFPALRVGYMVIPEDLVSKFRAVREAADIFPPTLIQAALADFINEGHFSRHLRKTRMLYMTRRNSLVQALRSKLGDGLQIMGIEAGMHLTALLPAGSNDVEIALRASEAGLSIIPLSSCCLQPPPRPGLVLGYGSVNEAEIGPAVDLLAKVLQAPV